MASLEEVMAANNYSEYQEDTIKVWYDMTIDFLVGSGIPEDKIPSGLVARGISDLWNYGAGDGQFSKAFIQLAGNFRW